MPATSRNICILGTHHAYQYRTVRRKYFQHVNDLIELHSVDLVAEEFTAPGKMSYAEKIAAIHRVRWRNVDLSPEERKFAPDLNPLSLGTLQDFELHSLREWVWVTRTASAMIGSALMICGLAHTISIAAKFESMGFEVEMHVYFDNADDELIANRAETAEETGKTEGHGE